jgi:hypothetical protein
VGKETPHRSPSGCGASLARGGPDAQLLDLEMHGPCETLAPGAEDVIRRDLGDSRLQGGGRAQSAPGRFREARGSGGRVPSPSSFSTTCCSAIRRYLTNSVRNRAFRRALERCVTSAAASSTSVVTPASGRSSRRGGRHEASSPWISLYTAPGGGVLCLRNRDQREDAWRRASPLRHTTSGDVEGGALLITLSDAG